MNKRSSAGSQPAVFICSSDNRHDVLEHILPSVMKFLAHRPYPLYVGMNTIRELPPHVRPVLAPASQWQREIAEQLA